MDLLDKAIAIEQGVNRLADALGVRQNVISNWKARRVPLPWVLVLTERYGSKPDPRANVGATSAQAARRQPA